MALRPFMRHSDTASGATKSTGTRIGYTRVSTVAQTLDQQNEALGAAGVTKVFSDVMSGARDDRPGLAALMEYVREGDTVVVWKLDRLGRNMLHILQTVKELDRPWRHPGVGHRRHRLLHSRRSHDDRRPRLTC